MNTLQKHKIFEKVRRNKDIGIIKPDKGNGVVVIDRVIHDQQLYVLLSDKNKFKKLSEEDPTKLRERQLRRYLIERKKKQFLGHVTYKHNYHQVHNFLDCMARLRFIKSNLV